MNASPGPSNILYAFAIFCNANPIKYVTPTRAIIQMVPITIFDAALVNNIIAPTIDNVNTATIAPNNIILSFPFSFIKLEPYINVAVVTIVNNINDSAANLAFFAYLEYNVMVNTIAATNVANIPANINVFNLYSGIIINNAPTINTPAQMAISFANSSICALILRPPILDIPKNVNNIKLVNAHIKLPNSIA